MKINPNISGFVIVLFLTVLMGCSGDVLEVSSVYCENRIDPVGVSANGFRFSWKLISPERDVMQTAYRLILTPAHPGSFKDKDLIWDSGIISSESSLLIPYSGPALKPGTTYSWKVRVWDNHGNESPWSKQGNIITGLESEADWEDAEWIGFTELDTAKRIVPGIHVPHRLKEWKDVPGGEHILPILRKEFSLEKKLSGAWVFVSGLGHYELRLNGEKVGDHFMAPGWTHYDEHSLYNVYDVSDMINSGGNSIGMMLGNGFYIVPNTRYRKLITAYGYPKMILMLKLEYRDGSSEFIVSNESWKAAPGPITYSNIFGGENYNATLEEAGWDQPGFDDSGWEQAIMVRNPSHRLEAEKDHPLKVEHTIEPVSIRKTGNKYLYDFGQNASGIIDLKISGKRGDTVKLVPSELLEDNLEPDQGASGRPYYFLYVLNGEGVETWSPRFTYYGFRYVQVQGAEPDSLDSDLPKILRLNMLHTRNSAPVSGEFNTSFELFNRINSLILWAIRSNIASVLTDCPHREKLGWLEQTYLMGGSIHYNFDIYTLYCKMIDDMIVAQTSEGLVPCIAPEFTEFQGGFRDTPEWGSASVILPWLMYKWYGDTLQMKKAWDMMCSYMGYLESKSEDHILSHGLGDWYDLGPEPPGLAQLTPVALSATATWYHDLTLLGDMAELLGKREEADFYTRRAEEVKKAFNATFFDPLKGSYATGSQTAMSMPLVLGLVEEEYRQLVLNNLVDSITASNKALTAGDVGFHFLVKALEEGGQGELLYRMNARDDVPGYGYQLKHGATTLTESWNALRGKSNNHLMLGHLMEWFYGGLAGIKQTGQSIAYKEILINPQFVGDISSASASFESPYGRISSSWMLSRNMLELEVDIPANSRAKIRIPVYGRYTISESGSSPNETEGLTIYQNREMGPTLDMGSGHYRFLIKND